MTQTNLRICIAFCALTLGACSGTAEVQGSGDSGYWLDDMDSVNNVNSQNNRNNTDPDMGSDQGTIDFGGFDLNLPDLGPDMDPIMPGEDRDGDGLEDLWEIWAGDPTLLDWNRADTDGDGTPDGMEDFDNDGLTTLEEYQAGLHQSAPSGNLPHPFRMSILVELDQMQGLTISNASLAGVVAAFADIPYQNTDGTQGVGIHIYRDEMAIAVTDFSGDFDQRQNFLQAHPPMFAATPAPLPINSMVHVMVVSRRTDSEFRGGEVVTRSDGNVQRTGLLIYYNALDALHPQCGIPNEVPAITLEEALTGVFVHEMGHILQLGHDDDTNGSTNFHNVMSVPTTCGEAQQRFHGDMNADPTLGATTTTQAGRFSQQAVDIMQFGNMVSVHTSELQGGGDGIEM